MSFRPGHLPPTLCCGQLDTRNQESDQRRPRDVRGECVPERGAFAFPQPRGTGQAYISAEVRGVTPHPFLWKCESQDTFLGDSKLLQRVARYVSYAVSPMHSGNGEALTAPLRPWETPPCGPLLAQHAQPLTSLTDPDPEMAQSRRGTTTRTRLRNIKRARGGLTLFL